MGGSGPQSKFQAHNLLVIFLWLCEVACIKQKLWYLKNALVFMNGKFWFFEMEMFAINF